MTPRQFSANVAKIIAAHHRDPFGFLGMHADEGGVVVRAFLPQAKTVHVIRAEDGAIVAELPRVHKEGLFAGPADASSDASGQRFAYRLLIDKGGPGERSFDDPYRFPPILGEMDVHLIAEGKHLRLDDQARRAADAQRGSRRRRLRGLGTERGAGQRRRRLQRLGRPASSDAPAQRVRRLGNLHARPHRGLALQVRDPREGRQADGAEGRPVRLLLRAGARHRRDRLRSRPVRWDDHAWMQRRGAAINRDAPVCIYEVHLGSWRRSVERRRPVPDLLGAGRHADSLRQGHGLHPHRGACRSTNIRSTARGAISRWDCSRRPAASAGRTSSAASSIAAIRPASA